MRSSYLSFALVALLAAALAVGAAAEIVPSRSLSTSLPVSDLALTGRTSAYVADHPTRLACARIGLWRPSTGTHLDIDAKEQCRELASTGQGVRDVSVATGRLLWLTYAGGNVREWSLWTATVSRRTPRRIRFVARDADAPPPIVLGPGAPGGMPYAVDRELVFLGDDGRRRFAWTSPDVVRAVAAGLGPNGWRVAALCADGTVVVLDTRGKPVDESGYPPGDVDAIRLSADGLLVQIGPSVDVLRPSTDSRTVVLPRGARMVDAVQGRILWTRAGDLGVTSLAARASRRLVDGTPEGPVLGQLEAQGIAWAQGRSVRWRPGRLP